MKLTEILSNPVRMRILQHIHMNPGTTTGMVSKALPDVPPATIYRHVNALLDAKAILVDEEVRVRGTTERHLVVNPELSSPEDIGDAAYQFLMTLYDSFRRYGSAEGRDPREDRLCFRTCMLHLTDESFDRFLEEYSELLARYMTCEDGGRPRSVSIISAPVPEDDSE